MLDKRCHYKVRELQQFYLFIKHKSIYYAYYPQYKKTLSTGKTNIKDAYIQAWNLLETIQTPVTTQCLFKDFEDKKRQRDLNYVLKFLPSNVKVLTENTIIKLQENLLKTGKSAKTVNNYIYILRKAYTGTFPKFKTIEHNNAVYRSCFPIIDFYHFYNKDNSRLHYLAFFAMTTGCRLSEIATSKPIELNGRLYLQINGTKTANAKRVIPVLPETVECIKYLEKGFRSAAYKESVIEAGKLCGFDESYIEENHIVFHSFRKMYKTLLESCNIPNSFIEYYMGHSQTNTVNKLYFIGGSADDSEVYPKVIDALKRFL